MTTYYARIAPPKSTVSDVIDFNPDGFYPLEWIWVEIPEDIASDAVERGLRYQDGEFIEPPPPRFYTIKSLVWDQDRVSDDDLEALANAIDSMSFRLRRQWADTMYLFHDDEPYLTVRANLTGVMSEEKIDRIFQQDGFEQA